MNEIVTGEVAEIINCKRRFQCLNDGNYERERIGTLNGKRERNGKKKKIRGEERAIERTEREENLTGASIFLSISISLGFSLRPTWHLRMSARNIATAYSIKNR